MGYSRLFAILANLKRPAKIRALATCSGIEETKGKLHKILSEEDPVSLELNLIAGISAVSK